MAVQNADFDRFLLERLPRLREPEILGRDCGTAHEVVVDAVLLPNVNAQFVHSENRARNGQTQIGCVGEVNT